MSSGWWGYDFFTKCTNWTTPRSSQIRQAVYLVAISDNVVPLSCFCRLFDRRGMPRAIVGLGVEQNDVMNASELVACFAPTRAFPNDLVSVSVRTKNAVQNHFQIVARGR